MNTGLFVGFHGRFNLAGIANEENPLRYVDLDTGELFAFIGNDLPNIGHLDNIFATEDSPRFFSSSPELSPPAGVGDRMKQNAIPTALVCAALVWAALVWAALVALSLPSYATEVKQPATQPATAPVVEEQDPLKFSEEADAKAKALRSVIQQEIKGSRKHAWAGQYYFGDGLGANVSLWLAPEAGFLYQWRGCLGLYDRNYGAVVDEQQGTIQLRFELECSRIDAKYVPVSWGERRYLVTKDQMKDFCDAVNQGREPRDELHGFFFIRNGDQEKRVEGLPDVPEEFRKLLTSKLESK